MDITLSLLQAEMIRDALGDMIANAEVDEINEPELEERIAEANSAYDMLVTLIEGE